MGNILPLSYLFELMCGLLNRLLRRAAVHDISSRRGADVARVLNGQHDVLSAARGTLGVGE